MCMRREQKGGVKLGGSRSSAFIECAKILDPRSSHS